MIAYILSIGDEVLLGDIVDTNASFLCKALKEMGIEVHKIIAIGDNVNVIDSNFADISFKADICLVTGGLGPTQDDLTSFACNQSAHDKLVLRKDALEFMKSYFMKNGIKLTKVHEKQAMMPSSSKILINHYGTAPGFYIPINNCLFFLMPGVPFEMKMMFENEVKKVLVDKYNLSNEILIERLTVFGLPESKVGLLLKGFDTKFPNMRLGFRENFPMIEIKIMLYDILHNGKKARADICKAKQWAIGKLEDSIVSLQGLSIAQEVGRLMVQQQKSLAVAEGCTGGLISSIITDIEGSSKYFKFATITNVDNSKLNSLNFPEKTIIKSEADHEKTALEMAHSAKIKAKTDFAISTHGIVDSTDGAKEKLVSIVCIGLAGPSVLTAKTYRYFIDDNVINKKVVAMTALELLRRHLVASDRNII
jgi:nicotinamide-nucleotide amidase